MPGLLVAGTRRGQSRKVPVMLHRASSIHGAIHRILIEATRAPCRRVLAPGR